MLDLKLMVLCSDKNMQGLGRLEDFMASGLAVSIIRGTEFEEVQICGTCCEGRNKQFFVSTRFQKLCFRL